VKVSHRLLALVLLAIPVFTGWHPLAKGAELLPGVPWGPVAIVAIVLGGVAVCCGRAFLANAVAITALILVPIVYAGGGVSWLLAVAKGTAPGAAGQVHGAHYVGLALNMLGVIPLALAIVASIPFDRLEQRLLQGRRGISAGEKYLLMFLRVFNHIVYFVIPNLLEVMREEALWRRTPAHAAGPAPRRSLRAWAQGLVAGMVQISVSGICASLRYIPLWAKEIDELPPRTPQKHRSPK